MGWLAQPGASVLVPYSLLRNTLESPHDAKEARDV